MTPAEVDIDRRKLLAHINRKARTIARWVVTVVLVTLALLAVGALAGHLMEVYAPVEPWSPPGMTTTPFPNGDF